VSVPAETAYNDRVEAVREAGVSEPDHIPADKYSTKTDLLPLLPVALELNRERHELDPVGAAIAAAAAETTADAGGFFRQPQ